MRIGILILSAHTVLSRSGILLFQSGVIDLDLDDDDDGIDDAVEIAIGTDPNNLTPTAMGCVTVL